MVGETDRHAGYQDEQLTHLSGQFLFYIDGAGMAGHPSRAMNYVLIRLHTRAMSLDKCL